MKTDSKKTKKTFDAVKNVREIKDKISAEIADMNFEQLKEYFKQQRVRKARQRFFKRIAGVSMMKSQESDSPLRRGARRAGRVLASEGHVHLGNSYREPSPAVGHPSEEGNF